MIICLRVPTKKHISIQEGENFSGKSSYVICLMYKECINTYTIEFTLWK